MLQVGCASASSTVTPSSSSRLRPRNGPPDAVSTSESTDSGSRPSRHWKSAECSESTGSSKPPPRFFAASARSPAATRLSLLASASVTPRSSAQSVAPTPAKPTIAFRTTSGAAVSSRPVTSPPTCVCATPCSRASSVRSDEPAARAQSSSSGFRSTTSIACRPIEPVAPSSAIRFTRTVCLPECQHHVKCSHGREEERVDPVEHAAVPPEQLAGVLHLQIALERRLEEVTGRACERDRGAEGDRLGDR